MVHMSGAVVRKKVERAVIENIPDLASTTCENTVQKSDSDHSPPPVTSSSSSRNTLQNLASQTRANSKGNSTWTCNICSEIFLDRLKLATHSTESHQNEYPAECVLCHSRFLTDKELGSHIRQSHFIGTRAKSPFSNEDKGSNGSTCDSNSNSIVLTSHNTNKPQTNAHPSVQPVELSGEPKLEPLRIQTNVLNTASRSHEKASKHKRPLKDIARVPRRPSTSIIVPISGFHCYRCGRNFVDIEAWTHHVVNFHIKNRNPYPIVEMNYVDPHTLRPYRSADSGAKTLPRTDASTSKGQEQSPPAATATASAKANEELKLKITMRRESSERNSYTILKRSSNSEDDSSAAAANDATSATSGPKSPKSSSADKEPIDSIEKQSGQNVIVVSEKSSPPNKRAHIVKDNCNSNPTVTTNNSGSTSIKDTAIESKLSSEGSREKSAASASDETAACTSISSTEIPLHNPQEEKVISGTATDNAPPTDRPSEEKGAPATSETVDKIQHAPRTRNSNEVSTIRKVPTSTTSVNAKELSSETPALNSQQSTSRTQSKDKDAGASASAGRIHEIISSNAKPLLRPITIGSMSIIPTDYSPDAEPEISRSSETTDEVPSATIEESEKDNETQPESILPLTDDDLERRSMISHDAQKLSEGVDIQTTSVTTITSETREAAGMLAKKKQFITTMMLENEIRDRQCNGTPVATDLSLKERNRHKSTNTSPETSRPNSNSAAAPQFENITPPNSEEADVDDNGENLVIHVRPEDVSMEGDDQPLRTDAEPEDAERERTDTASPEARNHDSEIQEKEEAGCDQQNESDDFKCRMCDKIFTSDAELHAHFNEAHLRIGSTLSSIFEPESPYPMQMERNEMDQEQIIQDTRRSMEMEFERHIVESPRRHGAELLSQTLTRPNHVVSSAAGNLSLPRPAAAGHPSPFQQHMQRQPSSGQGCSSNYLQQGFHPRPQFSSPTASRYPTPFNLRTGPGIQQQQHSVSSSNGGFASQQTMSNLQHLRFQQSQQQHQQQHQQQQHQRMLLQQQSMNRSNFNATTSSNLQRSLSTESNTGRPVQITRHNSLDHDGPRIVEVSSAGRAVRANDIHPSQHQLMTQIERRTNPNIYPPPRVNEAPMQNLLHSKRTASQDAQGSASKQPRLDNGNHLRSQNYMNQQHAQGTAQVMASTRQPYSQLEATNMSRRPSPPGPGTLGDINSNISSVRLGNAITLSVCPTTEAPASVITTRLDTSTSSNANHLYANVAHMSTDSVAVALATRGVTVTPAITDQITGPRRSPVNISISNTSDLRRSPITPPRATLSPVSPSSLNRPQLQSPPIHPSHQFAIPRGPAPRLMYTTATVNPSVERPDRPPTVDLTEDELNQQAARDASANRMQQLQAQAHAGRPIMPPDANPAQGHSNQGRGLGARAAFACNLCGVLYPSLQDLEQHKVTQHGISSVQQQRPGPIAMSSTVPQQRMASPAGNANIALNGRPPVPRPIHAHSQISPPQPQVQSRPTTANRTAQQNNNSRYLYIPLIDMSRLDASRLRRLEDLGILSMMPLHGNERAGAQMGIPILSLRPEVGNQHLPWDSVLPVGPVHPVGALANSTAARGQPNIQHQQSHVGTIHHHQR